MSASLTVGPGTIITVSYTAHLKNGQAVELPGQPSPLRFTWGSPKVWAALQTEIQGMEQNQEVTVQLEPENAFGARLPTKKRAKLNRARIRPETKLFEGKRMILQMAEGPQPYFVTDIQPEYVLLANNHPLAGEEITLNLVVLDIVAKRQQPTSTQP